MNLPTFKPYEGTLDRKKMSENERKAYGAFYNIICRTNKFGYQRPTFSKREFMGWWLESLKSFKGSRPSCGRLNHSIGYSWDNMEMQDLNDNRRESFVRNEIKNRFKDQAHRAPIKILVRCIKTKKIIAEIPSATDAANFFDVSISYISQRTSGVYKNPGRWKKTAKKIPFILERSI